MMQMYVLPEYNVKQEIESILIKDTTREQTVGKI